MASGVLGWLQAALLILLAALGTAMVLVREPRRQVLLAGVNGLVLTLLLMVLQAPDVALSELAVGGVVTPLMLMATLASTSRPRPARGRDTEADEAAGGADEAHTPAPPR